MKRYAVWALVAVLAAWFVQDPASADRVTIALWHSLGQAATSLSAFASGL